MLYVALSFAVIPCSFVLRKDQYWNAKSAAEDGHCSSSSSSQRRVCLDGVVVECFTTEEISSEGLHGSDSYEKESTQANDSFGMF